jgi:tetratricopeptide (TPR) repeat protein
LQPNFLFATRAACRYDSMTGSRTRRFAMRDEKFKSRVWCFAAVLAVLVLAAYGNNLHGAFVLDDVPWILNNPNIRSLWPIWKPLANTSRPVVQWSLAVNFAFNGLNAVSYHLTNNLLHALTALVLFGVVRRTLRTEQLAARFGDAADGIGFATALLWALHPLDTESVTYIIQRSESMAGLFSMLTLYGVIRGTTSRRAAGWNFLAVLSCVLAIGSKPVSVVIPFAVLAYDRVFLAGTWSELWLKRRRLYVGLACTWVVLVLILLSGQREWMGSAGVVSGARAIPWFEYARLQPTVILHYLRLSIWPDGLCLLYGLPEQPSPFVFWVQCAALAVLLIATVWLLWRRSAAGFLGAWFVLTLAPTSSVVPLLQPMFEHRMYLPLMAVIAAFVGGTYTIFGKLPVSPPSKRWFGCTALTLTALVLGMATRHRNADYRTEVSIWSNTARKAPANPDAHYGLALALATAGRLDEAGGEFSEALRLKPEFAQVQYNWGLALMKAGRETEALAHFDEAIRIDPQYADAQDGIGVVLYHEGNLSEAIEHFFEATRLDPNNVEAHRNLTLALREQQQRSINPK